MTDQPTQLPLVGAEKPKTKYSFVETPDGCVVNRDGGLVVEVKYADTWLTLNGAKCGLSLFYKANRMLAEQFAEWVMVGKSKGDFEEACDMIETALRSRFYKQWQRIAKELAPAAVELLSRRMFSSVIDDCAILHRPELYTDEHKFLYNDLAKYHACRMFAKHCEKEHGTEDLIERVTAWRQALTPTVPYKALNKTLDAVGQGVSWVNLHRLSTMRLEQPITSRLHLVFAIEASDHHNWGLHEHIVLTATDTMIVQAGELFDFEIKPRTGKYLLDRLAHRILDYPEPYGGDLLGLARRSGEWHEQIERDRGVGIYLPGPEELPGDTPLPLAALDYEKLAEDGITPLRTVGDCYEEHAKMAHCVHTYATKAAKGLCYLFHVEKYFENEDKTKDWFTATVEVLPDGRVAQAEGPHNENNKACEYGTQKLRAAFRGLSKDLIGMGHEEEA